MSTNPLGAGSSSRGYRCPKPGCVKTFPSSKAANECRKHLYACKFCELTYASRGSLSTHITRHHPDQRFKCDVEYCTFSSFSKADLLLHKNTSIHKKCPTCQAVFANQANFNTHKKTIRHKQGVAAAAERAGSSTRRAGSSSSRRPSDIALDVSGHSSPASGEVARKQLSELDNLLLGSIPNRSSPGTQNQFDQLRRLLDPEPTLPPSGFRGGSSSGR